jgi:hypothetical protein
VSTNVYFVRCGEFVKIGRGVEALDREMKGKGK